MGPYTPRVKGLLDISGARSKLQNWKDVLLIVKPETILRWHRQEFRLFWASKSRSTTYGPKLPVETITLIKEMAADNRLWGAEVSHS